MPDQDQTVPVYYIGGANVVLYQGWAYPHHARPFRPPPPPARGYLLSGSTTYPDWHRGKWTPKGFWR